MMATTSNPFGLMGRALSDLSGGQIGQMCGSQFFPNTTQQVTSNLLTGNNTVTSIINGVTNSASTNITSPPSYVLEVLRDVLGNPIPGPDGRALTIQVPTDSLSIASANGTSTVTNGTQTITSGLPTVNRTLNSASSVCPNNAQGMLNALEQVGLVHMLAEPNLTAVSGETAKFLAGGEFPVPVSRDRDGNVTVEFKQFGVGLSFTPVVVAPGRISLQLSSEVSELSNTGSFLLASGTSGLSIPALSVRRAQTTIALPSGGSFAVAGLMQHNTKQVIDGFPGVKDLPVLGALFRSRDFADDQTELVVLVSAYLVEPTSEANLSSPTDGFVAPSDPETLLLGRLNATYKKKGDQPLSPQASAPVGFIVR
jgi:Flp pilus assembly secretin CpaC